MWGNVIERSIMEKRQSYRWQKIGISITLLLSLALVSIRLASSGPNILGIFGFYILGWLIIVPLSVVCVFVRVLKRMRPQSFFYLFLGTANLGLSAAGIYFGIGHSTSNWIWLAAYIISGLLAFIMLAEPIYIPASKHKQKSV